MPTASKKVVNAWAMYDWANSVYNLVITSTIFPAYYEAITGDGNENTLVDRIQIGHFTFINTALYNYALAIAFVIVAIMSPILSSIADFRGSKKGFLQFFCTLGSISCATLYFFDKSNIILGLIAVIVACVGFWGSLVFYNSYLPEIAAPEDQDRVSAKGFTMGYIGSVILQIICFVFVLKPELFGITVSKASQVSFLLVGLWWFGFGQWSIKRLPKSSPAIKDANKQSVITGGYKELHKVWKQLTHMPMLKKYLTAFFFYNMGVQTVMLAATLYGKSELNIPTTNLIIAILIIQIVAIPGAILLSKLASNWGNLKTLMLAVAIWMVLCCVGYFIPRNGILEFYILAISVGFVMGGIQSVSRSTYAKLMPKTHDTTSFFSFYDVTEKIAIVIGMFSFGLINEITGSQRNSVLALCTFFILGFIFLAYTAKSHKHEIA